MNDTKRRARIDRRRRDELADDKRDEVGRHRDRLLEDDLSLAAGDLARAFFTAVGEGGEVIVDDERDLVAGLEFGLVPAWEGAARVGGFELRRRNDVRLAGGVGVLTAIEAVQLVVQDSAK